MAGPVLAVALARHLGTGAVAALAVLAWLQSLLAKRRPSARRAIGNGHDAKQAAGEPATHGLQRKAAIAAGGAVEHTGNIVVVPDKSFDLDKTIFKSVTSALLRYVTKSKIGNTIYWSDSAVGDIQVAYAKIPPAPSTNEAITRFMEEDCDFSTEHADGSFLDHLNFCHDYSAVHFKEHSPRVLFLHSIMGVGTNCFPMTKDKVPKLKSMLTDFEYLHIEAFPSILRLINNRDLLEDLSANHARLDRLESIAFSRVIDNEPLSMGAEDLWVQLNYQVVHLLDFLPAACWRAQLSEPLFATFVELITFLRQAGQLRARVNFEHPSGEVTLEGQPLTLGSYVYQVLPSKATKRLQKKQISKFSAAIGHSLDYRLTWAA